MDFDDQTGAYKMKPINVEFELKPINVNLLDDTGDFK
jgi:hypothetical protein